MLRKWWVFVLAMMVIISCRNPGPQPTAAGGGHATIAPAGNTSPSDGASPADDSSPSQNASPVFTPSQGGGGSSGRSGGEGAGGSTGGSTGESAGGSAGGGGQAGSSTRQEIFDALWTTVNTEYVDEQFNGVDWEAVRAAYQPRVQSVGSDEAFHNLMRQMIGELRDRHSGYYSPQEAWDVFKLSHGGEGGVGLGVSLMPLPDEHAAIVQWAIPGNAAANAGIKSGDLILAVNGKPVCCDANGNLYEGVLLDQSGTQAVVTVKTDGQPPRDVTVTRKPLVLQNVVEGEMLPGGIAYIRINTFLKNHLVDDFEPVWRELAAQHPRGLIIDLRTNGGGLKYEAVDILAYFLPDGEYGYFQSRAYDAPLLIHKKSRDVGGSQTIPLAVLVDETTASIAEVFALALQEAGRARVFGNPSAGNVEITRRYDLPAGAAALIAVERYISMQGKNIEGRGVMPDERVSQRWRDVTSPADDQALQAAMQWLARR